MTHSRLIDSQKRSFQSSGGGGSRQTSILPRLLTRSNQKLIAGYPSDSPVSTTDEECEVEDLGYLRDHNKYRASSDAYESTVQDDWSAAVGRTGGGLGQHQLTQLMPGSSSGRGGKRHWAPGEGIIDQHLFLLDDRPWQEFYTLFYTPGYCIAALGLVVLLLLLLLDGTVLYTGMMIFVMPCVILMIGLLTNFFMVCVFPVPSGTSATAFDNWADPFDQQ